MEVGKVSNELLEQIVFKNIRNRRNEVLVHPSIGMDTSVIDIRDGYTVVSCDPITGATKGLGKLAVNISCNDIATAGAEPVGLLVTILLPEHSTLNELEELMEELSQECQKLNVDILGGHTEVTKVVNQIVVVTTAFGKISPEKLPKVENIKIGDKIILTKEISIEGTSIIAKEKERDLRGIFSDNEIKAAIDLANKLSVVEEGILATDYYVKYMHDITEGGIMGALWETAKAINKGIEVRLSSIPLNPITEKLGEVFGIDVYKLISSGSMIVVMERENAEKYIEDLRARNIVATIIGEVKGENGAYIVEDNSKRKIESPDSDELYKIINN